MGELHLDIIKERIRSEYKIEAELGPLQIAYKETINNSGKMTHVLENKIGISKQFIKITLSAYPSEVTYKNILKYSSIFYFEVDVFYIFNFGLCLFCP